MHRSVKKPEPDDMKEGRQAVPPGDFLALLISPSAVRYGDLIHPAFQLGKFSRDLWLKSETIRLDPDFVKEGGSEGLVTGFHVTKIQIG